MHPPRIRMKISERTLKYPVKEPTFVLALTDTIFNHVNNNMQFAASIFLGKTGIEQA